jgi:hypothetical protein
VEVRNPNPYVPSTSDVIGIGAFPLAEIRDQPNDEVIEVFVKSKGSTFVDEEYSQNDIALSGRVRVSLQLIDMDFSSNDNDNGASPTSTKKNSNNNNNKANTPPLKKLKAVITEIRRRSDGASNGGSDIIFSEPPEPPNWHGVHSLSMVPVEDEDGDGGGADGKDGHGDEGCTLKSWLEFIGLSHYTEVINKLGFAVHLKQSLSMLAKDTREAATVKTHT